MHDAVEENARTPFDEDVWRQLAEGIRFVQGEFDDDAAFATLKSTLAELDKTRGTMGNHAFYLSIPPKSFPQVTEQLRRSGLADQVGDEWRRVVIEKPFGSDLKTARELNTVVESVFPPDSVFRIDHYLGKETVQNILALRFANEMYEPIWNANYVEPRADHHGRRHRRRRPGGYYDGIGAARDVIQKPPAPASRAHGDGGARVVRRRGSAGGEGEGAFGGAAGPPTCRSRPLVASTREAGRAVNASSASSRRTA